MWLAYACGSALFAGLTAILAKVGIRDTDSNVATALRTIVVLAFSWLMAAIQGQIQALWDISARSLVFLVLSGLATGASWLCYFRALQLGDVNKVAPIDKSSTVLTMLLAFLLLDEGLTPLKVLCMVLIFGGTLLMIQKKEGTSASGGIRWLIYAILSAVFASLTSILAKIGIAGVPSELGTAVRTVVVLIMAWVVVFVTGGQHTIRQIQGRSWLFLFLSGLATGGSWLCYYRALQDGPASVVVPIDKLSILVTVAFAWIFLKEKLSARALVGLACIVVGTLALLI